MLRILFLVVFACGAALAQVPNVAPTGSGTADYIPLWTTGTTLGNSLLFENSGKVGVGTTSPLAFFDVPITTTSTGNSQALRGSINVTPSASSSGIYEGVRGQAYDSGATNSIGQLKGFVAYTESASNQNVGAMYGLFSESQVSKSGGYAVEAYGAYANAVETEGTLTTGYGLYAQAQGAMTTGYGVYSSVINYGSGKPATGYGVYIAPLAVTGTSYGLYQAGANDSNYFAGSVTFAQPINLTGAINGVLTLQNNVYDPKTDYTSANVIAGYTGNAATNGATGATIGGGGGSSLGTTYPNTVSADFGTVSGGANNTASGLAATVAGGLNNTASGPYAIVAGGGGNTAGGLSSFAAGLYATASDSGSFVWCQQNGTTQCNSNGTNSFTISVAGPIYFYDGPASNGSYPGCYLSTGSGSWTCSSDRNLKDNIRSIDSRTILEHVAQMPISEWSMKADVGSHNHIGPMAQDFYASFGLGDSDKYIAQGDAQGVALASIQGLYQLVQEKLREKDEQIESLKSELRALEASVRREKR